MKNNSAYLLKLFGKLLMMAFYSVGSCFISVTFFGCTMIPGQLAPEASDENRSMSALQELKNKYPYIEFNRKFPETYLFKKHHTNVWNTILKLLEEREETILSKNDKSGEIVTRPKEISTNESGKGKFWGSSRLSYEQRILVKPEGSQQTYVTNHVAFFKSGKDGINRRPISLSNPENIIRGVFFGTMASAFYREKLTQPKAKVEEKPVDAKEVVHIVKSGETLGGIAIKYTGSALNYKAIADYNGISNPKALKVGQKIKIPKDLQRKK